MGRLPKGFKKTLQPKSEEAEAPAPAAPSAPAASPASASATSQAAPSKGKGKPEPQDLNSSFLKDSGDAAAASSSAKPAQKGKQAQPAPAQAASEDSDHDSDGSDEASGSGHGESKGQMIQRHKREMQAFKKNLPRLGKKSKEEVAKLTAEIEARHAKELAELTAREAAGGGDAAADSASAGMAALSVSDGAKAAPAGADDAGGAKQPHMTKAMKRRQKAADAEAEREARIAAEAAAAGPSARATEEEALFTLLTPLGLKMREIRADGHCLYRSLEDQLTQVGSGPHTPTVTDYTELRRAAARYMREHADEYAHFVDAEDGESPSEALERHCQEVEDTAAWGGQLELSVLAQVLRRPIRVYAVGMSTLTLGEEYEKEGVKPLQVCYLRHAFGLGEHYNSLETTSAA